MSKQRRVFFFFSWNDSLWGVSYVVLKSVVRCFREGFREDWNGILN